MSVGWWILIGLLGFIVAVAVYDVIQKKHAILRNFPVIGHLRYIFEAVGPELRQYIVTGNDEERPFSRDQRRWVYASSKKENNYFGFGTDNDLELAANYLIIKQSTFPKGDTHDPDQRIPCAKVLGEARGRAKAFRPESVIFVSAMSYGSLSKAAVEAINRGCAKSGTLHNTGEGGIAECHLHGAPLIWQLGTGYFGARTKDGRLDLDLLTDKCAEHGVKAVEIKLSQGAKPGHGGILPAAKVSAEIAEARRVPEGQTCFSPPGHTAFDSPTGLLEWVAKLRELSGGKPVGFKLCVGNPREFFAVCKAMLETHILPDFVTVDGGEGGTGAAPIEFSDHLGAPLRDGLILVHNALVGVGLRDQLRIAASAKRTSGFEIAAAMAMGADWCNSARGFMFAVGCIQAQSCHTNKCPVGVTTQDPRLQRALDVDDKAERVYRFHRNTVEALAEVTAAAGLSHPTELTADHLWWRLSLTDVRPLGRLYELFEPGQLLDGKVSESLRPYWEGANPAHW